MATYRISGIWKNTSNVITHYAIHIVNDGMISRAKKTTKNQAVTFVQNDKNIVTTYLWNYRTNVWNIGESVHVVDGANGKFLRSNADNRVSDNLDHLINFNYITINID